MSKHHIEKVTCPSSAYLYCDHPGLGQSGSAAGPGSPSLSGRQRRRRAPGGHFRQKNSGALAAPDFGDLHSLGRHSKSVQSVAAIAVSTVLGFLSGLGVGGGSLLMLWLTGPLGWPQAQARALNLLFFLPGASLATFLRRKRIPWKQLLPGIAAGCLFAWLASLLQGRLSQVWLRRAFGILLIFTGIRELRYKVRE